MGLYQSFPGSPGDSSSGAKLASLALPPLTGKTFLDVGCNEGYFCGYAFYDAARKVVGIDKSHLFIELARDRFPACVFIEGDWGNLDGLLSAGERFDVILCSSALYYADDQAALLAALMRRLSINGTLVLETGLVEDPDHVQCRKVRPGWYMVKRSIDDRLFPDWSGMEEMLSPFAWKYMGKSAPQIGDPLPRHVFHIKNRLPYALLLMGASASGKSTVARELFGNLKLIRGDGLPGQFKYLSETCPILRSLGEEYTDPQKIDRLFWKLFESGGCGELAGLVTERAGGKNFVYDGFIPPPYRDLFADAIENAGYRVLRIDMASPPLSPAELSRRSRLDARKYELFLGALNSANRMRRSSGGRNQ